MRLNPPLTISVLLVVMVAALAWKRANNDEVVEASGSEQTNDAVALVASAGKPPHGAGARSEDRCQALIAFLEHALADETLKQDGRKLYLSVERRLGTDLAIPPELERQFRDDPELPLTRELIASSSVDPRDRCQSVRTYLAQPAVSERFTAATPTLRPTDASSAITLGISLPAVSADGHMAMMDTSVTFGPLAGGGSSVVLRKDTAGRWVVAEERPTWIS